MPYWACEENVQEQRWLVPESYHSTEQSLKLSYNLWRLHPMQMMLLLEEEPFMVEENSLGWRKAPWKMAGSTPLTLSSSPHGFLLLKIIGNLYLP